jgi:hypothetical protein
MAMNPVDLKQNFINLQSKLHSPGYESSVCNSYAWRWTATSFHFVMRHWILSRAFISVQRENGGLEKKLPTVGDWLFAKMEKRE